jgi:hypothetical protein
MPTSDPRRIAKHCPDCQGAVVRLPRQPGEAAAQGPACYHCLSQVCAWRGPLGRALPLRQRRAVVAWQGAAAALRPHLPAAMQLPWRRAGLGLVLAASFGVPLAVLTLVGAGLWLGPKAAVAAAPGVSHDGRAWRGAALQRVRATPEAGPASPASNATVAATPAAAASAGLSLRHGCVWGQPGRNPYRGSTEQALQAAGLPPEVVQEVAALRQAGRRSGRLEIRTGAIRSLDDGRQFNPRSVALSFGQTMCLNSRVNFVAGHTELADLYEVRDARGRRHAVMVPDVCGNVSVLGVRGERGVLGKLADALAQRSADAADLASALGGAPGQGASGDDDGGNERSAGATTGGGRPDGADHGGDAAQDSGGEDRPRRPGAAVAGAPAGGGAATTAATPTEVSTAAQPVPAIGGAATLPWSWPSTGVAGAASGGGATAAGAAASAAVLLPAAASAAALPASAAVPTGTGPRGVAVAVLNTLSDKLAQGSAVVVALSEGGDGAGVSAGGGGAAGAAQVPEPDSLLAALSALAALAWVRRRAVRRARRP